MPRGKNYVNNNRGVSFQASTKKKGPQMVACQYGDGCTRKGCIYRHPDKNRNKAPTPSKSVQKRSQEPCMPFLAGLCSFTDGGCRKRHPGKAEAERLVAKYSSTPCRYGSTCRTRGCLYIHPDESGDEVVPEGNENFTPSAPSTMFSPHLSESAPSYSPQTPAQTFNENEHFAPRVPQNQPSLTSYSQPVLWEPSNNTYPNEDYNYYDMQTDGHSHTKEEMTSYGAESTPYKAQQLTFDSMGDEILMDHDVNGTNIHAKEFIPGNWS